MSKSNFLTANVEHGTDSFAGWIAKTNQIIQEMGTSVVTTANVSQPNTTNGGTTTGNAHVSGILGANTVAVQGDLRGGSVSGSNQLDISSNTSVTGFLKVSGTANVGGVLDVDGGMIVNGNTTFNDNLTVEHIIPKANNMYGLGSPDKEWNSVHTKTISASDANAISWATDNHLKKEGNNSVLSFGVDSNGNFSANTPSTKLITGNSSFDLQASNNTPETGQTPTMESLLLASPEVLKYKGNDVFHKGSMGANTGFDADLLDGFHAVDLRRKLVDFHFYSDPTDYSTTSTTYQNMCNTFTFTPQPETTHILTGCTGYAQVTRTVGSSIYCLGFMNFAFYDDKLATPAWRDFASGNFGTYNYAMGNTNPSFRFTPNFMGLLHKAGAQRNSGNIALALRGRSYSSSSIRIQNFHTRIYALELRE